MKTWLKSGADSTATAEFDLQVRATVEQILANIAECGGTAVRELSMTFDNWDRDDYRLVGHGEQASIRVRRYGSGNILYGTAAA